MRNFFSCVVLLTLAIVTLFAGCTKSRDSEDLSGGIKGQVSPAKAVISLSLKNLAGSDTSRLTLDSSGNFKAQGVKAGNYRLAFYLDSNYTGPTSIDVTIKEKETFELGLIGFTLKQPGATNPPGIVDYGTLTGKFSVVSSGLGVNAKSTSGTYTYYGIVASDGSFKFNSLPPGTYLVSFTTPLSYSTPVPVQAAVTNGKNTDIGTINLAPPAAKAIDTISGLLSLYTQTQVDDFLSRVTRDSAVVLMNSFYVIGAFMTPELKTALNKVIVCKSIFSISTYTESSLTLTGLKETAQFTLSNSTTTSLSLPGLTSCGILYLNNCPNLNSFSAKSNVTQISSLYLNNSAFVNLQDFGKLKFNSGSLEVINNSKLLTLEGLSFTGDSLGQATIQYNPLLPSLKGLQPIRKYRGQVTIMGNTILSTLEGLENARQAKILVMSSNPQLNDICPAKVFLNYLKDAPDYKEMVSNGLGSTTSVTRQPLTASFNGKYSYRSDIITALANCP